VAALAYGYKQSFHFAYRQWLALFADAWAVSFEGDGLTPVPFVVEAPTGRCDYQLSLRGRGIIEGFVDFLAGSGNFHFAPTAKSVKKEAS
jgi:hypothetical protein